MYEDTGIAWAQGIPVGQAPEEATGFLGYLTGDGEELALVRAPSSDDEIFAAPI